MTLYSSYDQFYADNPRPEVLGGRNRSLKATRDPLGRFMPASGTLDPDPNHGRPGGRKVFAKYGKSHMAALARRSHEVRRQKNEYSVD